MSQQLRCSCGRICRSPAGLASHRRLSGCTDERSGYPERNYATIGRPPTPPDADAPAKPRKGEARRTIVLDLETPPLTRRKVLDVILIVESLARAARTVHDALPEA
jgi:hypothetical protein